LGHLLTFPAGVSLIPSIGGYLAKIPMFAEERNIIMHWGASIKDVRIERGGGGLLKTDKLGQGEGGGSGQSGRPFLCSDNGGVDTYRGYCNLNMGKYFSLVVAVTGIGGRPRQSRTPLGITFWYKIENLCRNHLF